MSAFKNGAPQTDPDVRTNVYWGVAVKPWLNVPGIGGQKGVKICVHDGAIWPDEGVVPNRYAGGPAGYGRATQFNPGCQLYTRLRGKGSQTNGRGKG